MVVVDSVVERCWLESQSVSQQSQGCEVLRAYCALYLARFLLPPFAYFVSQCFWLVIASVVVSACVFFVCVCVCTCRLASP